MRDTDQTVPSSKTIHDQAAAAWEANAESWTTLARGGHDVYRDFLNTPGFFAMLPDVAGRKGLDIGCGEGHNTRLLRERGAEMFAIDVSKTFVRYAVDAGGPGIHHSLGDAIALPFADGTFDFACAFMSLMDVPETEQALAESYRVLKPGGFLQFSITHPCFDTPHRRNLRKNGLTYAIEVGDYFRSLQGEVIDEWLFKAAPAKSKSALRPFRILRFTRTLSFWMNSVTDAGFRFERMEEPRPDDATVRACHGMQDAQVVAYFLHIRARRPE